MVVRGGIYMPKGSAMLSIIIIIMGTRLIQTLICVHSKYRNSVSQADRAGVVAATLYINTLIQ